MRNNKKMSSGITLIALVVTIIVLLILAGISIAMLSGNNGILTRATEAKTYSNEVQIKERIRLAELSARANGEGLLTYSALNTELTKEFGAKGTGYNISDETENPWVITVEDVTYEISNEENLPEITADTPAGTVVKTPSSWTSLLGKAISDGNGTAIPLPTGFYYVGGNYNTGLVISDKENDTMDASGTSMGNQFVWIPVSSEDNLVRTKFDTNTGNPKTGLSTSNYIEPYTNGYSDGNGTEETEEFNTMKQQVLKYGGFYIGRYEAGINSTTLRNGPSTDQNVVCKKGVAPFNWVPWGVSNSDVSSLVDSGYFDYDAEWVSLGQSYGAVYLSKNMYLNASSVTSTLCYGSQWDAMCRYIGDSQRKTTTKSNPQLTGSVSTDVSKNIYDLAGNCFELSMEYRSNECRQIRGGACNSSVSIFNRFDGSPSECSDDLAYGGSGYAFRVTLYIN